MCVSYSIECYNLVDQGWIPVLYCHGGADRVGILKALTEARTIRQIAAGNPMDRAALLRFLLAVLMWCKEDAKSSLKALLDEKRDGIPLDWLKKLEEKKSAFNLLGDGQRFYQDKSLEGEKCRPIGDLLVEFPGQDSVNHMRHVLHYAYGFCPACCAMGIIRFTAWSPANRYYPSSVNPASAAYALVDGKNLLETLWANLPDENPPSVHAPWLQNEEPESPDAVFKLAWRPRKFWLKAEGACGICANCGRKGILLKRLAIEKGWATPVTSGQKFANEVLREFQKIHEDYRKKNSSRRKTADKVVKAAPVILKCRKEKLAEKDSRASSAPQNETEAAKIARIVNQLYEAGDSNTIDELTKRPSEEERADLQQDDIQQKKFWTEDPHLLRDKEALSLPGLDKDVALHASRFWRDALRLRPNQDGFTAIGPVVNQFTFQDCVAVALPKTSDPIQHLADLSEKCREAMPEVLKKVMKNPLAKHPEIVTAVKLLTPNTEAKIRERLSKTSAPSGDHATCNEAGLQEIYAPIIQQVAACIIPGSPLLRLAAQNRAKSLLERKIRALLKNADQPTNNGLPKAAPEKPKRGRKKGGSQ